MSIRLSSTSYSVAESCFLSFLTISLAWLVVRRRAVWSLCLLLLLWWWTLAKA